MENKEVIQLDPHKKITEAAEAAHSRQLSLNELGLARRLEILNNGRIKYISSRKRWMMYDDKSWKPATKSDIFQMFDELEGLLKKERWREVERLSSAGSADPSSETKSYHKAVWNLGQHATRTKVLKLFQELPEVHLSAEELDCHPWLLGCPNGVVDLKSGKFLPAVEARDKLITKSTLVDYNPKKKCATWERFLLDVFCGDQEMVDFMQRVLGYSLTGTNKEKMFFLLYGESGNNGKTTLIETISNIVGDYSLSTPSSTFVDRKGGDIGNDLARLKGSRLIMASESGEQKPLNANLVKQITGNDTITVRYLYKEFFSYVPQFTCFFLTNHRPQVTGTDEALWNRLALIRFMKSYVDDDHKEKLTSLELTKFTAREGSGLISKKDRFLPEKLKKEYEGILAWMIAGAQKWINEGELRLPKAVVRATNDYRKDMDVLHNFLHNCTEFVETNQDGDYPYEEFLSSDELWEAWREWTSKNNERTGSKRWLGINMKRRGFTNQVVRNHNCNSTKSTRVWLNIRFKTE